jgi:hypothetical protein
MASDSDAPRQPRRWVEASKGLAWYARVPFFIPWAAAAFTYELHRSPFLALAKLAATFALPLAAITYCSEAKDRRRDRVYKTWEVVTKAEGRSASGARYEALQDLNESGVSLSRSPLSGAWMEEIDLRGADLRFADIRHAFLRGAKFGCRMQYIPPGKRCSRLRRSLAGSSDLAGADFQGADLSYVSVDGADLTGANLRGADLEALQGWNTVKGWRGADLRQVRNADPSLIRLAADSGAIVDR